MIQKKHSILITNCFYSKINRTVVISDFRFWMESQENKPMNAFPSKSLSDNRKSAIQNRKWAGLFAIVVTLTVCGARVEAQQPTKVPRIGFLSAFSGSSLSARIEAFRQGLRELGYVEGKNIVVEYRWAEGKIDPDLTATR